MTHTADSLQHYD